MMIPAWAIERLAWLNRELRRVSTPETDPDDRRVQRERELREEHHRLLLLTGLRP